MGWGEMRRCCMVRYGMVWGGVEGCGTIQWFGMAWYDASSDGMVRYSTSRDGTAQDGTVRYDMVQYSTEVHA